MIENELAEAAARRFWNILASRPYTPLPPNPSRAVATVTKHFTEAELSAFAPPRPERLLT